MNYNPTVDYGRNAAATNTQQQRIAATENEYMRAVLGDPDVREQDALRHDLASMRALLGEIRVRAQEITRENLEELQARKALLELGKG